MNEAELDEIIAKHCLSDWEGCLCWEEKGHEGPHKCGSKDCESTWNDEQARLWGVYIRRKLEE